MHSASIDPAALKAAKNKRKREAAKNRKNQDAEDRLLNETINLNLKEKTSSSTPSIQVPFPKNFVLIIEIEPFEIRSSRVHGEGMFATRDIEEVTEIC
jgi:hypothetical protein